MKSDSEIINKEELKTILNNFFSLTLLKALTYLLPLITFPYLIRVLGVDKFGLVMFAQATMYYFEILVDFGFNLSATREVALNAKNKSKLNEIISSVFSIKLVLLIISGLLLLLILSVFDRFSDESLIYYYSFLKVIAFAFFPVWFFQGIEKMKYVTIINIISKVIFTILIFVFIQSEKDYLLVPLVDAFGFMIGSLVALYYVFKRFNHSFVFNKFTIIKQSFIDSSMFFLSRVSVSLYTSSNILMLGLVASNVMVGYYAIAEKLYMVLRNLYQPIVQVIYPYISKSKNVKFFKKLYPGVVILNFIGVYILWVFTPELIYLVSKEHFVESIKVFRTLLIVACIVVPSILIGYPFLAALGFKNDANYSTIIGSLFHVTILGVLYFINLINIYNIVYLLIATESIVLLYRYYAVYKNKLFQIS
jgi:PST family polysaccharide transporter|tara:strand:- start:3272 stop:4534 length:1263 start_codon:yes stop_codon:yes gene_type:complete